MQRIPTSLFRASTKCPRKPLKGLWNFDGVGGQAKKWTSPNCDAPPLCNVRRRRFRKRFPFCLIGIPNWRTAQPVGVAPRLPLTAGCSRGRGQIAGFRAGSGPDMPDPYGWPPDAEGTPPVACLSGFYGLRATGQPRERFNAPDRLYGAALGPLYGRPLPPGAVTGPAWRRRWRA
jgi:hypothetical protein